MTWRKFFKSVNSVLPVAQRSVDSTSAYTSSSKYSNWLPEVYAGPPDRLQRYSVYEQMMYDHEISAAIDTIADFGAESDEVTQIPLVLKYHDEPTPSEIQILEKTLGQWIRLNKFNRRLWKIFRSTLVYGDQFFLRDPETFELYWIDPSKVEKVIVNESDGKKIESYFIKNIDLNIKSMVATNQLNKRSNETMGANSIIFSPPMQGNMNYVSGGYGGAGSANYQDGGSAAVDAAHIVQLSLSDGMSQAWPFGLSILEQIFKVYKQKELLEDAILIYRVHRAPERRVFFIDVGTMPPNKAQQYLERVRYEVQQKRIPSRTGGGCFAMDTKVPLLDGRVLSIAELTEEYNLGKENWAYSCDPETGKTVPGLITWAGVTQKSAKVMKLTLDNGETIICTLEHKFPIIGKGKVEAKDIVVGSDSLYSFNTRCEKLNPKQYPLMYHQVFNNDTKKWEFTHRVVANYMKDKACHNELVYDKTLGDKSKTVIHHKDYRKLNNNPDNLYFMHYLDHILLHSSVAKGRWNKSPEGEKQAILDKITPWDNQSLQINDQMIEIVYDYIKVYNPTKSQIVKLLSSNNEFMDIYRGLNFLHKDKINKLVSDRFCIPALHKLVEKAGFNTWKDVLNYHGLKNSQPVRKLQWDPIMLKRCIDIVNKDNIVYIEEAHKALCSDTEFMNTFTSLNDKIKGNAKKSKFTMNTMRVFINHFGYKHWGDFKEKKKLFNHKVVSIEYLGDEIEVGTLTIDGNEKFHNYHTFAIEQGVYTFNSSIVDSTYNPMCGSLHTEIPLLDGRTLTLSELINEFESGKENLVYSVNQKTCTQEPGKIIWAGVTRPNAEVLEITLSNDKILKFTPDHRFIMTDGSEKEAQHLQFGDTLMSLDEEGVVEPHFVTSVIALSDREDTGDITVETESGSHNFATAAGVYVHNSILEDYFFAMTSDGRGSKVEVLPGGENLGCFALDTKIKLLDGRDLSITDIEQELKDGKKLWTYSCHPVTGQIAPGLISWAGKTKSNAKVMKIVLDNNETITCTPDHQFPIIGRGFVAAEDFKIGQSMTPIYTKSEKTFEQVYDPSKEEWQYVPQLVKEYSKSADDLQEYMFNIEQTFAPNVKESMPYVKIVDIIYVDEPMDVGTLSIDIDERYHDYHTYALSAGVFAKNSIDDLRYFNNKMVRALGVPSSYLPTGPEDGTATVNDGRVGSAYMQEYRFSKVVTRYQQQIIDPIDHEFKLFLKFRGFTIDSSLFELAFTPAQSFSDYRKLELDSARINTFTALMDVPYVSKRFILTEYLGWTEAQLIKNERMWKEERSRLTKTFAEIPAIGGSSAASLSNVGITSSGIDNMTPDAEDDTAEPEAPNVDDNEVDNFGGQ